MADSNTQEVQLAPGIGGGAGQSEGQASQSNYAKQFDPQGYVQEQQGQEAQSLLNAATPTPTGTPMRPPINEALSNLGKIEPQQVADASRALTPLAPSAAQGSPVTSILNSIPQQVPQTAAQAPADPFAGQVAADYNKQMQANNAIAGAVEAKAVADQAQMAKAETAYAEAEVKRVEAKAKFDTDYNGKMAQYEQSVADYKQAAGEKVVPGAIVANMNTGQKLQSGIFMALSAYGSALSGQENQALKVINNAINNDIEAQKFNIDNKLKGARMGVEGSQYLVSQMRAKWGDDESAILASRAAMIAMTQQQLSSNASKLDQATAGPKAQALNAQLDLQKQQVLQQLKQAQAQQYILANITGDKVKNLNDNELTAMESVNKGYRDRYVHGFGPAANLEQAKKFTEYASEVRPAIDGLDRIKELSKGYNKITDVNKRGQIETEIAGVVGALRIPITGPGILTESERKMLEDIVGNPSKIISMPSLQKAKLDTIYGKLQNDLAKRGDIAGLPATSFKKSSKSSTFKD